MVMVVAATGAAARRALPLPLPAVAAALEAAAAAADTGVEVVRLTSACIRLIACWIWASSRRCARWWAKCGRTARLSCSPPPWRKEVHALAGDMLKDRIRVNVGDSKLKVVKTVKQNVMVCDEFDKPRMLDKVSPPPPLFLERTCMRFSVQCFSPFRCFGTHPLPMPSPRPLFSARQNAMLMRSRARSCVLVGQRAHCTVTRSRERKTCT